MPLALLPDSYFGRALAQPFSDNFETKMDKNYQPAAVEPRIYAEWEDRGTFG